MSVGESHVTDDDIKEIIILIQQKGVYDRNSIVEAVSSHRWRDVQPYVLLTWYKLLKQNVTADNCIRYLSHNGSPYISVQDIVSRFFRIYPEVTNGHIH
jgi:hypothetical protein